MTKSKEIFLTGATGFIGRELRQRLFRNGIEVETNLRYLHSKKYECIVHLAAVTHTRAEFDPALIEANYILTNEIFKSSARIIFASSCSAKYDTNPYAQSKIYAEHLAQIHGNATGLRLFNVYGPHNGKGIIYFLMQQPNNSQITVRGPELIRDYIHVDDVVDYIMKEIIMSANYSSVFEVGTAVPTTTIQLVNMYMDLSGKNFDITCIDAYPHEPLSMISRSSVSKIVLHEGLEKIINQSHEYQIL